MAFKLLKNVANSLLGNQPAIQSDENNDSDNKEINHENESKEITYDNENDEISNVDYLPFKRLRYDIRNNTNYNRLFGDNNGLITMCVIHINRFFFINYVLVKKNII